jgi:hypothetical protein
MMLKPILATLALLGTAAVSHAEFSLDLESGLVWTGTNDIRVTNDNSGTLFSLSDQLTANDPSAFFRARATWHLSPKHDISVLYAPLSEGYEGLFPNPVTFAGTTFAANTPTTARYRFDSYRLTYRYNFITTEKLTFGLGITGKIRDAEVQVNQGGLSANDANTGFVPLINFRLDYRFAPKWSFLLEGDALVGPNGRAEDVLAALQYHPTQQLSFRLGYRILEGGVDSDTTYNQSLFQYLAAGVTVRF